MNHTGDPIERLDEHKYLSRLEDLYERIEIWMQVGPACTEEQWNEAERHRDDIHELMRLIKANDNYKVPAYRLKLANRYWQLYDRKNKVLKWDFTKHRICQE
tara:strand:- start:603 stop:908 length:306 start_codon:yes stop_codon:yes gene_type:complete